MFDSPVLTAEDRRERYGEQRIVLIGWLHGQFVQMVHTERDDDIHVISLRKATRYEIEIFREAFPGPPV